MFNAKTLTSAINKAIKGKSTWRVSGVRIAAGTKEDHGPVVYVPIPETTKSSYLPVDHLRWVNQAIGKVLLEEARKRKLRIDRETEKNGFYEGDVGLHVDPKTKKLAFLFNYGG